MSHLIPTIIVGGYLGAGKTCLINDFLRRPNGLRALVLVNDFGAINIDADLIENTNGDTIALTNGCACCSIGDSLLEAALSATTAAPPPDLLIVEASGVSQPARIADTLMGAAALAPATCLTVVNGARAARNAKDKYIGQLFRTQIETADILALNRFDTSQKQAFLKSCPPLPLVGSIADAIGMEIRHKPATEIHAPSHDPEHGFHSTVVSQDEPITPEQLETWMNTLPPGIERLKGIVLTQDASGKTTRMSVSYVQGLIDVSVASSKQEADYGTIVVIARKGVEPDVRFPVQGA